MYQTIDPSLMSGVPHKSIKEPYRCRSLSHLTNFERLAIPICCEISDKGRSSSPAFHGHGVPTNLCRHCLPSAFMCSFHRRVVSQEFEQWAVQDGASRARTKLEQGERSWPEYYWPIGCGQAGNERKKKMNIFFVIRHLEPSSHCSGHVACQYKEMRLWCPTSPFSVARMKSKRANQTLGVRCKADCANPVGSVLSKVVQCLHKMMTE